MGGGFKFIMTFILAGPREAELKGRKGRKGRRKGRKGLLVGLASLTTTITPCLSPPPSCTLTIQLDG